MELDNDTIQQIKKNDRKVILQLYENTFNVLMSTAVRYKSNKEGQMEIVNASFMKIIGSIEQFKVGSNYFSWAKRIVQNTVIDDFRKNKKYQDLFKIDTDETSEVLGEKLAPEVYEGMQAEEIEHVLNQLPPATKVTFNLFAIDGYSYKEVAEELNVGYETVKWHVKEARKRLKTILSENNELLKH
ncbi:MAG: RNA polymerase sigma factor [Brumimicrobium sp.]